MPCRHIGIIREGECRFAPVAEVMQEDYLRELYGVPLRVLEVEGERVIV